MSIFGTTSATHDTKAKPTTMEMSSEKKGPSTKIDLTTVATAGDSGNQVSCCHPFHVV